MKIIKTERLKRFAADIEEEFAEIDELLEGSPDEMEAPEAMPVPEGMPEQVGVEEPEVEDLELEVKDQTVDQEGLPDNKYDIVYYAIEHDKPVEVFYETEYGHDPIVRQIVPEEFEYGNGHYLMTGKDINGDYKSFVMSNIMNIELLDTEENTDDQGI